MWSRPGMKKCVLFTWILHPGLKFHPHAEDRDESSHVNKNEFHPEMKIIPPLM